MATLQQLKKGIASTKSIQKITNAMQMVAASKLKKAQENAEKSRSYAQVIQHIVSHLGETALSHPYLKKCTSEEVKHEVFIVVSSNRGLCGGFNNNLFKTLLTTLRQKTKNHQVSLCIIGKKAADFFIPLQDSCGFNVLTTIDTPATKALNIADLIGTMKTIFDGLNDGLYQKVHLAFNRFNNVISQTPELQQMIPIDHEIEELKSPNQQHWDYLYEEEELTLLSQVLKRYLESQLYQAVVESVAGEQAARMTAMQQAKDNAGDMIEQLNLDYNQIRQAKITQEISEIINGSEY
ncbi:MAG: ATP synthase F1 subunit gamma [Candidatus Comchoanobacterales bacterium]